MGFFRKTSMTSETRDSRSGSAAWPHEADGTPGNQRQKMNEAHSTRFMVRADHSVWQSSPLLPHPRFRGGMPSSPSPYKGEGKPQ